MRTGATSKYPKLRRVQKYLDDIPSLPVMQVELLMQIAERWMLPIGKLVFASFPPSLRKAKKTRQTIPLRRAAVSNTLAVNQFAVTDSRYKEALATLEAGWGKFSLQLLVGSDLLGIQQFILAALADCVTRGHTALLLVPEIKDANRWCQYLQTKLVGCSIVAIHSGSTPHQRAANWLGSLAGSHHVMIGTRNVALYPLADLGLAVVIDENNQLYRAERGLSFPARDVAALQAKLNACPLLMTATIPSLELYHAAQNRHLKLNLIPNLATQKRPHIDVINISNRRLFGGISVEMENSLRREFRSGGLSMILINRRGHGNMLYCAECRQLLRCTNCLRQLTQRSADECFCRFCGNVSKMPSICPACGGPQPEAIRPGSMRIATTLATRLPDARILRIDSDSSLEAIESALSKDDIDIIVGTQALLGYDLAPGTCILSDADSMLNSSSFKAAEHLLDTLTKLAQRPSVKYMVVQTRQSDHHVFTTLQSGKYSDFAQVELKHCKAAGLPPFRHFALLSATGKEAGILASGIGAVHELIKQSLSKHVMLFEPVASGGGTTGAHKMQVLISAADRGFLKQTLQRVVLLLEEHKFPAGFSWNLRVEPDKW